MASAHTLEELIKQLPLESQNKLCDFAAELLQREKAGERTYLRQNWAGSLRKHRNKYDVVELQHRANEWRQT